jgi:hypothetical protein
MPGQNIADVLGSLFVALAQLLRCLLRVRALLETVRGICFGIDALMKATFGLQPVIVPRPSGRPSSSQI